MTEQLEVIVRAQTAYNFIRGAVHNLNNQSLPFVYFGMLSNELGDLANELENEAFKIVSIAKQNIEWLFLQYGEDFAPYIEMQSDPENKIPPLDNPIPTENNPYLREKQEEVLRKLGPQIAEYYDDVKKGISELLVQVPRDHKYHSRMSKALENLGAMAEKIRDPDYSILPTLEPLTYITAIEPVQEEVCQRSATGEVMIVDDEECVREILTAMLRERYNGTPITEFSTADAAKEAIDRGAEFTLGLFDYSMPGMSGLQLLEYIRTNGNGQSDMPILMITGHVSDDLARQVRDLRAEILGKPFAPDGLYAFTDQHL